MFSIDKIGHDQMLLRLLIVYQQLVQQKRILVSLAIPICTYFVSIVRSIRKIIALSILHDQLEFKFHIRYTKTDVLATLF